MTDDLWNEPAITINGTALTIAQAMTVRVAIGSFILGLQDTGLGDDEHGKAMTGAYLAAAREITRLLVPT